MDKQARAAFEKWSDTHKHHNPIKRYVSAAHIPAFEIEDAIEIAFLAGWQAASQQNSGWQPIESAPYDQEVLIRTYGGLTLEAKLLPSHSLDASAKPCDQWVATTDLFPECWSDGECWEYNADLNTSDHPQYWTPLPQPPKEIV